MSEKQLIANQNNSLHSTGPRTEKGKQVVSQNATKYGIYSTKIMQLASNNEDFKALQAGIVENYQPASQMESILVNIIIENTWRLNLISKAEQGLFRKKELEDTAKKCIKEINSEMSEGKLPVDEVAFVLQAYSTDKEKLEIGLSKTLIENIENLIRVQKELSTEELKLADSFHFDSINSEAFTKLARYRKGTEHSLYLAIEKLNLMQKDRIYKDLLVAKSVSIQEVESSR